MASLIKTKDGKRVGILEGNVLRKYVNSSKHLFRSIGARGSWGIDYDVLFDKLPERCLIRVEDKDEKIIYTASAATWKEYGEVKHFKSGGVDHSVQVFLPVEYFKVIPS